MNTETPPTTKPYGKPGGERRGLLIVNMGDGWLHSGIPAQRGIED